MDKNLSFQKIKKTTPCIFNYYFRRLISPIVPIIYLTYKQYRSKKVRKGRCGENYAVRESKMVQQR